MDRVFHDTVFIADPPMLIQPRTQFGWGRVTPDQTLHRFHKRAIGGRFGNVQRVFAGTFDSGVPAVDHEWDAALLETSAKERTALTPKRMIEDGAG